MTGHSHRILIGSLGWQFDDWQDSFYPEDLPLEWRLGYYSNEFPLAVITDKERQDETELLESLDDCREDILLLLSVAITQPDDSASGLACRLARQFPRQAGLLLQVDPSVIADPDAWLERVAIECEELPLCILPLAPLNEQWRAALQSRKIGWGWNEHTDSDGLGVGPLAIMQVEQGATPRELRERLEAGLAVSDEQRHVGLMFTGEPPSIEAMRQARTLDELM
ncbi:MAG: hypothetical protein PVG50_01030 [Thiohalophilus sp.]|jgi:hypothetical protein